MMGFLTSCDSYASLYSGMVGGEKRVGHGVSDVIWSMYESEQLR